MPNLVPNLMKFNPCDGSLDMIVNFFKLPRSRSPISGGSNFEDRPHKPYHKRQFTTNLKLKMPNLVPNLMKFNPCDGSLDMIVNFFKLRSPTLSCLYVDITYNHSIINP